MEHCCLMLAIARYFHHDLGMTEQHYERVGPAVRARRLHLELTQQQCADLTDKKVSLATWNAVENGRQERVQPLTAVAICKALGWTEDSIDRIVQGGEPYVRETIVQVPGSDPMWASVDDIVTFVRSVTADLSTQQRERLLEELRQELGAPPA